MWHAVEWIKSPTVLHGIDEAVDKVFACFATIHILNVQRATGVVRNDVTPHAVIFDLGDVVWLVAVEHRFIHHAQTLVAGQVVQHAQ